MTIRTNDPRWKVAGLERKIHNVLQEAGFDPGWDFWFESGLTVVNLAVGKQIVKVLNDSREFYGEAVLQGNLVKFTR